MSNEISASSGGGSSAASAASAVATTATGNVKTRLMPQVYHEIPGSDQRGLLLWCRPRQNFSFHSETVWHTKRSLNQRCIPSLLRRCAARQFLLRFFQSRSPPRFLPSGRRSRETELVFVSGLRAPRRMRRSWSNGRSGPPTNFVPNLIASAVATRRSSIAATIVREQFPTCSAEPG